MSIVLLTSHCANRVWNVPSCSDLHDTHASSQSTLLSSQSASTAPSHKGTNGTGNKGSLIPDVDIYVDVYVDIYVDIYVDVYVDIYVDYLRRYLPHLGARITASAAPSPLATSGNCLRPRRGRRECMISQADQGRNNEIDDEVVTLRIFDIVNIHEY